MKINVIAVGNIKEKYLNEAILEYKKRLQKHCDFNIIEVKDESNNIDELTVKKLEGQKIINKINPASFIVLCDLNGDSLSSIELANKINEITTYKNSNITFIIGGSYGFSSDIYKIANYKISFSKMTFPHQLMRVILLEQIYRAFKILNNETYHK